MKKTIEENVKRVVKGEARKKVQARKATINKDGQEVLDETPIFVEVGQKPKPSLNDIIRKTTQEVTAATIAQMKAKDMSDEDVQKILDEENDFDIPDDVADILTPYEAADLVDTLEDEILVEDSEADKEPASPESGPSTEETPPSPPAEQKEPEPAPTE